MAVGHPGQVQLPRPDLAQAAQHQARQDGHGRVMVSFEQPAENLGERHDPDNSPGAHQGDRLKIALVDGAQDRLVFSEKDEDEGAGNSRQDHSADGHGAAEEEEPPGLGRLNGDETDDHVGAGRSGDHGRSQRDRSFFKPFSDDDDRGQDQAEKEAPDQNGFVDEEPFQSPGQGQNGQNDPEAHGGQERPVENPQHLPDVQTERRAQERRPPDGPDRLDQFLVDAENEGHGSAGNPGNHVGGPHAETAKDESRVFAQGSCPAVIAGIPRRVFLPMSGFLGGIGSCRRHELRVLLLRVFGPRRGGRPSCRKRQIEVKAAA